MAQQLGIWGPLFRSLWTTMTGSFFLSFQKCAAELTLSQLYGIIYLSLQFSLHAVTQGKGERWQHERLDTSDRADLESQTPYREEGLVEITPIGLSSDPCPRSVSNSMRDPPSCAEDIATHPHDILTGWGPRWNQKITMDWKLWHSPPDITSE